MAQKSIVVLLTAKIIGVLYEQAKNNVTVNAAQGTWGVKSRDELKMPQYRLTGEVFGRHQCLDCLFRSLV